MTVFQQVLWMFVNIRVLGKEPRLPLPITVLGVVLLVAGGWKFLFWGIFFRTVLDLHSTWLVNSATHMWGRGGFPPAIPPETALVLWPHV